MEAKTVLKLSIQAKILGPHHDQVADARVLREIRPKLVAKRGPKVPVLALFSLEGAVDERGPESVHVGQAEQLQCVRYKTSGDELW